MKLHTYRQVTGCIILAAYLLLFASGVHHYHHFCLLKPESSTITQQFPSVSDPFAEKGSPCYFHATYNNLHQVLPENAFGATSRLSVAPLHTEPSFFTLASTLYASGILRGPPVS